jgi:hypothetical protein
MTTSQIQKQLGSYLDLQVVIFVPTFEFYLVTQFFSFSQVFRDLSDFEVLCWEPWGTLR